MDGLTLPIGAPNWEHLLSAAGNGDVVDVVRAVSLILEEIAEDGGLEDMIEYCKAAVEDWTE